MSPPDKVLTLRALGLGDFLTAVPALRALEEALPRARHVLAAPEALSDLVRLAGLQMEVEAARHLGPLSSPFGTPDLAVNLHGSGPESHRTLLETRPAHLIAFRNDEVGNEGPEWADGEHEVVRWCRMLGESGIQADPSRLYMDAPPDQLPIGMEDVTIIHPGAKSPARRWPLASWADVARQLADEGHRMVFTGSSAERHIACDVARRAGLGAYTVLAGCTDLAQLASLVSGARLVVCGDTGVAHLASAVRTPSVVLFGPTDPTLWGPPTDGPHVVLWNGTTGDPHATTVDPGLAAITPAEVVSAVAGLSLTANC